MPATTCADLKQKREDVFQKLEAIGTLETPESPLDEKQLSNYAKLEAEHKELTDELGKLKASDDRGERQAARASEREAIGERLTEPDSLTATDVTHRDTSITSFLYWAGGKERLGKMRVPLGYKPYKYWTTLGDQLHDMLQSPDAFVRAYKEATKGMRGLAVQGMNEGIGSDGGFLIMPEFSQEILRRTYENSLVEETRRMTTSTNAMTFPREKETSRANGSRHGGIQAFWTAEGESITSSKPALGEFNLKLEKLAAIVYLTDELMADAPALGAYVNEVVPSELEFKIGDAIIRGTGNGQPLGILNSDALVTVTKETDQDADTIVVQNIDKMWARLNVRSQAKAKWYINQNVQPLLAGLARDVGTGGQLVYNPPGGISAAPFATLEGVPVVVTEFNSSKGDVGDIILADLSQYVTLTKTGAGIQQDISMHVQFLTAQQALRFLVRIDGGPWENSTLTPFKGTGDTVSSFVTLAAR